MVFDQEAEIWRVSEHGSIIIIITMVIIGLQKSVRLVGFGCSEYFVFLLVNVD